MSLPGRGAVTTCLLSPAGPRAGVDMSRWSLANHVAGPSLSPLQHRDCILCTDWATFQGPQSC